MLTTPRLILRPAEPDDAGPLTALLAGDSAGIAMTAAIPDPATEAGTRAWLARVGRDGSHAWTIVRRDTGRAAGVAGWVDGGSRPGPFPGAGGGTAADADTLPEIGYWIGRDHRRQGFGGEAVAALLTHLAHTGARGAVAEVFLENAASLALLVRLGFRVSGIVERDVPLRGGLRPMRRLVIDGPPFR